MFVDFKPTYLENFQTLLQSNRQKGRKKYIMIRKKNIKKILNLVGMCLLLGVITSQAATLTVNTTADAGIGSLRQAILDATTDAAINTVTFNVSTTDSGYNAAENRFTINLLSPLPDLPLAPLTINNNQSQGVTIKGNNSFRIFTLVNSAVVTINNLTISNGFSDDGSGGGIITGNDGLGGGIFMGDSSTLSLNGSIVSDNTASRSGGGIYLSNSSTLSLNNSTFRNNTADNGGGIYINDSGTLNINSSTINGNAANNGGNGGGIFNNTSGTVNATNNTIDGNSAVNNGGGIYNAATITFTSNTISNNTAAKGGGIYNSFTATLNNNIVALNKASDGIDLLGRESLGNAFTGSYNLIGNADGSEGLAATNQLGSTESPIDPRIGILKDNGGATFTRALLTRSPAIDKGNSPSTITDQRGETRPYDNPLISNAPGGDSTDIGAFERTFSPTPFDFDGDGKADISVFRPSDGTWYFLNSTSGFTATQFGIASDKLAPADFDADGKTDLTVFRDGTWYLQRSSLGFVGVSFGEATDIPVPADYDGDGKADFAVFRPSDGTWYIYNLVTNQVTGFAFGQSGDVPVAADYDGDGRADIAVFRQGIWYLQRSDLGFTGITFGTSKDIPVAADYDGDGRTDVAVFRPSSGTWFTSEDPATNYGAFPFGQAGDAPVAADYDGDGRADAAVFRDGTWYMQRSQAGFTGIVFGEATDKLVPNAFVP